MKKIIFLLLSVCLFVACSKEDEVKETDLVFLTVSGDSLEPRTVEMVETLIVDFNDSLKYTKVKSQVTIGDKVVHLSACVDGVGDGNYQLGGTKYANVVKLVRCEAAGDEGYKFTSTEYVIKSGTMNLQRRLESDGTLVTVDLVAESEKGASVKMKGQMIAVY